MFEMGAGGMDRRCGVGADVPESRKNASEVSSSSATSCQLSVETGVGWLGRVTVATKSGINALRGGSGAQTLVSRTTCSSVVMPFMTFIQPSMRSVSIPSSTAASLISAAPTFWRMSLRRLGLIGMTS
jgi:hypothetical protein